MMSDDMALVREYARNNSDEVFSDLVRRHIPLVYSVALRQVRDAHLAEEITQVVFIILARKARSLGPKTILSGWLCSTARYASANALKMQYRRQRREQEAQQEASMQSTESHSEAWAEIAPLLDDALSSLGEKEHNAVVLRFFDGKDYKQVGAALSTGEDTARMRVNRALEKMRKFFRKRGVVSTTAILAGEMSANAVHAAPPALANSVTAAAMVKGAATGASTLALVHGTLKAMTWAKVKFACGVCAVVLLAGSLAAIGLTISSNSIQDDRNDRYQMEGHLVYAVTASPHNFVHVRNFTLTVNGRNWAIHITPENDPLTVGIKYQEEVCLDGAIYRYDYYGKPPAGDPAQNTGGATIEYGESAVEDGTLADFVWVGLASGYYFSHATNGQVTSLFGSSRNVRNWHVETQWQLHDAPPYLPKSIDYSDFGGIGRVHVLQETKINGRIFPTEYTYEQTSKFNRLLVTVGVRKISLHSVPDVHPPRTEGETIINDYRGSPWSFPKGGNLYVSTSGYLPEKPDLQAIKEFKKQIKQQMRK